MKPEQLRAVLGANIKRQRQLLRMTQSELGARIGGLTKARISQMESGRQAISSDTQALLAEALGTEVSVLNTPIIAEKSRKSLSASA